MTDTSEITTRKRVYGWVPSLPDWRDHIRVQRPLKTGEVLPPLFSMRTKMPSVYDQLQTGSCTGNATAAAIDYNEGKQGRPFITPSRLFPYFNARVIEGTQDTDAGAQVRDVIKAVATLGICTEAEWPYIESNCTVAPSTNCYADALKNVVSSYASVGGMDGPSIDDLRGTLYDGEPVIFGMSVYESFESNAVAQTGFLPMPTANEKMVGGHCILMVGYDDKKQVFEIRNSWGADFGDGGYFYMPYSYITPLLTDDFWTIKSVS